MRLKRWWQALLRLKTISSVDQLHQGLYLWVSFPFFSLLLCGINMDPFSLLQYLHSKGRRERRKRCGCIGKTEIHVRKSILIIYQNSYEPKSLGISYWKARKMDLKQVGSGPTNSGVWHIFLQIIASRKSFLPSWTKHRFIQDYFLHIEFILSPLVSVSFSFIQNVMFLHVKF